MLTRRGASLVELLVAMTLAAVVLGAASSTFVRQRRDSTAHASRLRAESQVRAALGELQVALEGLSSAAGDLAAGETRDTALQLRTVVASATACDSSAGQATFAADDPSDARASGVAAAPRIGDSLWWRATSTSSWIARRVTAVGTGSGVCPVTGSTVQSLLHLAFAQPDTVPKGAPLRLTRQSRYSFYHASDGTWQLGLSEWSEVLRAFAPPQPIAGPFTVAASGNARTGFRFFDAADTELHEGEQGIDAPSVARVRVTLVAPELSSGASRGGLRRDSLDVALSHAP